MDKNQAIQQQLRELFESQNLAVLATHRSRQPYASLVAFYATEDLKHLFFVTPKTTRKFENLKADAKVAMLVNSTTNQAVDFHQAVSVTVVGTAAEIVGPERQPILKRYLEKHPYLEDFVRSPSCALVRVSAKSYFMVQNFQNVMELHLNQ
ncbi:MAG: pyridoxamine 5'-phosphate oxidase family protein [Desulfobacterales bacterium]|nr:MAG: pyridoxamine 5'-phosphate oxidase family protein [Desulfobacterales bacterium]